MSNSEISALEYAGRNTMVWSPEGYDGSTHYGSVLAALTPALFILGVAAALLFTVL